jgi:hypothetical protein
LGSRREIVKKQDELDLFGSMALSSHALALIGLGQSLDANYLQKSQNVAEAHFE